MEGLLTCLAAALEKVTCPVLHCRQLQSAQVRKQEGRLAADRDLSLTELLRYQTRDSGAARDLLFRRIKSVTCNGKEK